MNAPPLGPTAQALQREVSRLMFSADGQELNTPTVALARLHDLTTTLSMLRNYVNVDVHHVFNHVIAREFGAFTTVELDPSAPDDTETVGQDKTALVRSAGLSVRTAETSACAMRAAAAKDRGQSPPPLLIDRLKAWLRRAVTEAQAPDGPRYMPGRRGFAPSAAGGGGARPSPLDAQQFMALANIIGTAGTQSPALLLLPSPPNPHAACSCTPVRRKAKRGGLPSPATPPAVLPPLPPQMD